MAKAFGISTRHVRRLVSGEQRPVLPDPRPVTEPGKALAEVEEFLQDLRLRDSTPVLAATARALASKLDQCAASPTAAAAQAMPRVAAQLVDVLARLDGDDQAHGPDQLDEINARRAARMAEGRWVAERNGAA